MWVRLPSELQMTGKLSNIVEKISLEWSMKHCLIDNKEDFIKNYKTHAASLKCGFCENEPYITGFNLLDKKIKCCLCGEVNDIE